MGNQRDFRAKEIARLQFELANASQRLEALERRARMRARYAKAAPGSPESSAMALVADMPELRFAACVASGMTKLQAS